VLAAGLPEYRPGYDALQGMGFYNLNPDAIREIQQPDAGELLRRDGSNLASVVARLAEDRPEVKQRIQEYLGRIVPEIVDFERAAVAHNETLQFRQKVTGSEHPWRFYAESMSDGTLRTLGILVAAMQLVGRENPIPLVGIEEPETALHPAAVGALMDALREAAASTQIVATTHSPDLLDRFDPDVDTLLAVVSTEGITQIGPADEASLQSVRDHLFTAGDLLRMDQLQPAMTCPSQMSLFDEQPA
jgi:predicted ATPase